MRFLIVDTLYPGFMKWLYTERDPGLGNKSFAEQYAAQVAGFFHTAGAWTPALQSRGHEVLDVSANNLPMQMRWMLENGLMNELRAASEGLVFDNQVVRQKPQVNWQLAFVAEQVKRFKPDVLLSANLYLFDDDFLAMVAGHYGVAVGQHAAVMPNKSLKRYDLIISSLPNQVTAFREAGIKAELVGLAFDQRLLGSLGPRQVRHDVAFVGSVSPHHAGRARFLAEIGKTMEMDFWGSAQWPAGMDAASLRIKMHPAVFGLPMYQTLRGCRMVLNYHLDAAGPYANNLRLFEATGVGALLVTDDKLNIRDYFEPGQEIVTFADAADAIRKLQYCLAKPDEAEAIAAAGHKRVLADHTYDKRAEQLLALVAGLR